jgi:hypothetical protein
MEGEARKACTRCGVSKDLSLFVKCRRSASGRKPYCKECEAARVRQWNADNPDKRREADKRKYEKNKDEIIARAAQWRKDNSERYREWVREDKKKNPAKYTKTRKDWRDNLVRTYDERVAALTITEKLCRKCQEVKPLSEFFVERRMRDGRQNHCKACDTKKAMAWRAQPGKKDAERKRQREWYHANPEKIKQSRGKSRLRAYGLTPPEYDAMVSGQDNQCAICKSPAEMEKHGILSVDHCHATGAVRGLLCSRCNHALGHLRDNPVVAHAAADYLERHAAKPN